MQRIYALRRLIFVFVGVSNLAFAQSLIDTKPIVNAAISFSDVQIPNLVEQAFSHGKAIPQWDPNSFGGNWRCFGPQITGCIQGFDAVCAGGSTNDQTAAANLAALRPATVNVYFAPGFGTCQLGDPGDNPMFGLSGHAWAYGVSFNKLFSMAGLTYFADNNHDARIQSISAGSCTVTLVTDADASKFSVGDWIQTGDTTMTTGNLGVPMTLLHSEANQIIAKGAALPVVLTISPCLQNSYSSTLPAPNTDSFQGGPATIWLLQSSWNVNINWHGLSVLDGQTVLSARAITTTDVMWADPPSMNQTPAPSGPGNITINNGYMPSMEIDKNAGNLIINSSRMKNVFVQSAGSKVQINNSTITVLQGTTTDTTINSTTIGAMQVGPTNGPGGSLVMNSVTVGSYTGTSTNQGCSAAKVDTSVIDSGYSNGTFTVARAAALANNIYATFIPGGVLYFGETDGTNDSSPHTQFSVTSMTQDATNTFITTGNWKQGGSPISTPATLPTPTCNTHACLRYIAYQLTSLVANSYLGPSFAGCVAP